MAKKKILKRKRDGQAFPVSKKKKLVIPTVNIKTNLDGKLSEFPKKRFKLWIVDMKTKQKVAGTDTIVKSQSYGQAVDDFIIDWNKKKRMGMTIGYPIVQGIAV